MNPQLKRAVESHRDGRLDEAEALLREVLAATPTEARAHFQLGVIALDRGAVANAHEMLEEAVRLEPGQARYWMHLGRVRGARGDEAGARQALHRAHELDPSHPDVAHWLGISLARAGRWSESLRLWEASVKKDPSQLAPRLGIANALVRLGRGREASLAFATAAFLAPERAGALESQALFAMQFGDFTPEEVFRAHEAWGTRRAGSFMPRPARRPGNNKLRIGYVSPRFQRSAQAFALLPVLEAHDREHFEVYCYAEQEATDAVTARFRGQALAWRETQGRTAEEVAAQVRADGIDVLVDLAGHTPGNRLDVFALRPAPVAMSWLDYFDTTGVAAIDAIVGDDVSLAPPMAQRFIEFAVSAGPVRYPYRLPDDAPAATPVASAGEKPFTFASFARRAKITPAAVAAWARIVGAVPGSRLLLKNDALADPEAAQALREAFTAQGLDKARLELRPESGHREMLAELLDADLVLDTFPYNGGITTCEALAMARPVVTLSGGTLVGRQGASFLAAAGLGELVARDVKGYEAIAIALAGDRERLARLSSHLLLNFRASPVCDAPAFTRRLESLCMRLVADLAPAPGTTP